MEDHEYFLCPPPEHWSIDPNKCKMGVYCNCGLDKCNGLIGCSYCGLTVIGCNSCADPLDDFYTPNRCPGIEERKLILESLTPEQKMPVHAMV
jgi:hypothetical protein